MKVVDYEKKIKRLRRQLKASTELRRTAHNAHLKFRENAGRLLAESNRARDVANAKVLHDAFRLEELSSQIAVQQKLMAEAVDDRERAMRHTSEAARYLREQTATLGQMHSTIDNLRAALEDAQQLFRTRLWNLLASWVAAARLWYQSRRNYAINWLMVRRLNAARLSAMNEAGHVPTKLIKMAHRYYEHDKNRLERDEEVTYHAAMHSYTEKAVSSKPSLWRRIKILAGRA